MESFLQKLKKLLNNTFNKAKYYISEYGILLKSDHQEVAKVSITIILLQTVLLCCFFSSRANRKEGDAYLNHTKIASTIIAEFRLQTENAPTQTLIPNIPHLYQQIQLNQQKVRSK